MFAAFDTVIGTPSVTRLLFAMVFARTEHTHSGQNIAAQDDCTDPVHYPKGPFCCQCSALNIVYKTFLQV